jgi:uncharacterized membrane protein YraQ (UPF0718 family)
MNMNKKKKIPLIIYLSIYLLFIIFSYIVNLEMGKQIGQNFKYFALDTLKLFPPAFILVGLFMVWINKETIEKFFGKSSGFLGYISAIVLACTTLYPFIVVLPMAGALYKKGGKLSIVLTYLGASAICRIPMSIFEASYLGLKFTLLRYVVSLPLIIFSSILIEKMVKNRSNDLNKELIKL